MSETLSMNQVRNSLAVLAAALAERRAKYAEGLRALELLSNLSKGQIDENTAMKRKLLALASSVTDAIFAAEEIRQVIEQIDAADREGVQNVPADREPFRRLRRVRNQIVHRGEVEEVSSAIQEINREVRRLAPLPDEASFARQVREAVSFFSHQEFGVTDVESILPARGVEIPAGARQRIAMALSDLVRKGVIEVTSQGTGNRPNRYRRVVEDERNATWNKLLGDNNR